ncbi:MAG: DUF3750 domain-containing protein [Gammaproteobacteria bacterium]|nr:DUF3750 domain-containing protein [Gammaproteobacteria bacterium]
MSDQETSSGKTAGASPRKYFARVAAFLLLLFAGPMLMVSCGNIRLGQDWRTADRSPTGVAPDPVTTREAVIQVYAARAFNWRGMFAVHTWIATKPEDANQYTVHQVVGWRRFRGLPVLASGRDVPDRSWFGSPPEIIADIRGEKAEALIPKIFRAVKSYPYPERYTTWPGPNSNTFVAHVAREVPELRLELPTTAIGKDYLPNGRLAARAPSGTGYQLSLFGLLGITAAAREGLELNLLGLAFGIDPEDIAIKLPGIGNVGLR